MFNDLRIKEAEVNVRGYLEDGLIKKEKNEIIFEL